MPNRSNAPPVASSDAVGGAFIVHIAGISVAATEIENLRTYTIPCGQPDSKMLGTRIVFSNHCFCAVPSPKDWSIQNAESKHCEIREGFIDFIPVSLQYRDARKRVTASRSYVCFHRIER